MSLNVSQCLMYLQDELVDEGRCDSAEDGTQPVDPVVVPGVEHDGGAQGPGRVHAGPGERDGEEVAGGDGQADGEGGRASHTLTVVSVSSRGEDDQDQDHRDDELDTKALAGTDVGEAVGSRRARDENTQNTSSDSGSDTLRHHVQQTFQDSDLNRKYRLGLAELSPDLGSGDETRGDGGVDVTAGDVAETLGQGGHRHSEAESDLDNIVF